MVGGDEAEELELAKSFLAALEVAAQTGERDPVYPFLAADVRWVTPQRELVGLDAVRTELTWGFPPEALDVGFEHGDWERLPDGRLRADVRQVYRLKKSGERAYTRVRRIELTIRDGKVSRYEMRGVG